ncbi:MAG: metallophosphoesterase family protein [Planctomycetes bacterium]|nr:metallophosphoesterase family protein [Planctomycetota bacterium]
MNDKLIAVLSDVHGNEEAFSNALTYLKGLAVEEIYCLGDLVGYGQGGAACVRLARQNNVVCLQGNHDAQIMPPRDPRMRPEAKMALDIAAKELSPDDIRWLQRLPTEKNVDDHLMLVHGALTGRDDYILTREALAENMRLLTTKYAGIHACFFGHTHLPLVVGGGSARSKFPESDIVDLEPRKPYLINPGSVGQPRDGVWMSSFVIYDRSASQITMVRLEYDIKTEQNRMRKAGLPEKLVQRIALGK